MRRPRPFPTLAALLLAAALAASAGAARAAAQATAGAAVQAGVSENWAGYVASGGDGLTVTPTTFSNVSGTWVVPKANCGAAETDGGSTAAAFWVGLGGNATDSNALEQTGTEADCNEAGAARYFAWYELVPAGSVTLALKVAAGDTISGAVSVAGTHVTVSLKNLTSGASFSRTLPMADPDTTSAEWIAEAPSVCGSESFCREQSLTDFGKVDFSKASATSAGQSGPISDPAWTKAAVELQSGGGGGFRSQFSTEQSIAEALPSSLSAAGTAFSVSWKSVPLANGGYGGGGYGGGGYGGGGYGGGGYGGGGYGGGGYGGGGYGGGGLAY